MTSKINISPVYPSNKINCSWSYLFFLINSVILSEDCIIFFTLEFSNLVANKGYGSDLFLNTTITILNNEEKAFCLYLQV